MNKDLSEQQRRFAEGRAQGMTGEDAVKHAGYKSRGKSARVQCAQLLAKHSVTDLIEELRSESRAGAVKTAQEVKEDLSELLDSAKGKEDYSGFTQLANRLAKMDGHDEAEKIDHKHSFFDNIPTNNGLGKS